MLFRSLITIMSAFKTGNVVAFKLDSNVDFSFANFRSEEHTSELQSQLSIGGGGVGG